MITFLYDAHLAPDRLDGVAPGAEFLCAAHVSDNRITHGEGVVTVSEAEGETVWGAVFTVPDSDLAHLDASQAAAGRRRENGFRAMDRDGTVHDAVTYVADGGQAGAGTVKNELAGMVSGGRHWDLPPGWVAGLEELVGEA